MALDAKPMDIILAKSKVAGMHTITVKRDGRTIKESIPHDRTYPRVEQLARQFEGKGYVIKIEDKL